MKLTSVRLYAVLPVLVALVTFTACGDDPTGPSSGDLQIQVAGLPSGSSAAIEVTGPGSYQRLLSGPEVLSDVPAGEYTVSAVAVDAGEASFAPIQPEQTVAVEGGGVTTVHVEYADMASGLEVNVRGLPSGEPAAVRVTGPGGFVELLTGSRLLPGLEPGAYTVTAVGVAAGDSTYQSATLAQEVMVGPDAAGSADVVYTPVAARGFNLAVEGLYIVQVTQSRNGRVPLVAGRDGYVRVFAVGSDENTATPAVRLNVYHGDALKQILSIPAGRGSVAPSMNQGELSASWNVRLDGELIQPGLRVLAEVDPTNGVAEADETDNAYPVSGTPQELEVVETPTFKLRLVPIHQDENDLTGRVTQQNMDEFLTLTRKIHPLHEMDVDLRATYTTDVTLDRDGSTWSLLVSELDAVRVAEGTDRYYYGVVQTPYNGGGVVGIAASIGSRTSLGWDLFPYAPETLAHELGHNWGRYHSPCMGAGGADPSYPYVNGFIGTYGLDVETLQLKGPFEYTDIMGYCDASWWISDYTYTGILRYRQEHDTDASATKQSSLLVWGRIVDGRPILEPAFRVDTRPRLPSSPGPNRIEGLDAEGSVLFSVPFQATPIPDVPRDQSQFAFAIPMTPHEMARLATVRLRTPGGEAEVRSRTEHTATQQGPVEPFPRMTLRRSSPAEVTMEWNGSAYPMVMVRDPRTGEVLSFGRSEVATLRTSAAELELIASDGVRSVTRRLPVERR